MGWYIRNMKEDVDRQEEEFMKLIDESFKLMKRIEEKYMDSD